MTYQGMVVLAGNQVWWTWEVEDVFRKVKKGDKMGMKNYARKMHKQISDLVQKVCSQLKIALSYNLTLAKHVHLYYICFVDLLLA